MLFKCLELQHLFWQRKILNKLLWNKWQKYVKAIENWWPASRFFQGNQSHIVTGITSLPFLFWLKCWQKYCMCDAQDNRYWKGESLFRMYRKCLYMWKESGFCVDECHFIFCLFFDRSQMPQYLCCVTVHHDEVDICNALWLTGNIHSYFKWRQTE